LGEITHETVGGYPFTDVSVAGNSTTGELHLVALTSDGKVWHTIREATSTWLPFRNIAVPTGGLPPGVVSAVSAALVTCYLHVVVATSDGTLWHTIRNCDGTWTPYFLPIMAGAGNPGQVGSVSIAGNSATGELHVVAATADGKLVHTVRRADQTWSGFEVIPVVGLSGSTLSGFRGRVGTAMTGAGLLGVAGVGATLHVAAIYGPLFGLRPRQ
jgi:hypothetical protein